MTNAQYDPTSRTKAVPPFGAAIGFVFGALVLALSVMVTATGIA